VTGTPKQARSAVTAIFFLNGLIFGAWAARIPAVRDHVGLSDGELGIVLACAAVGSILALPIAGARASAAGAPRARPLRSSAWRPASSRSPRACRSCVCWPSSTAPPWARST